MCAYYGSCLLRSNECASWLFGLHIELAREAGNLTQFSTLSTAAIHVRSEGSADVHIMSAVSALHFHVDYLRGKRTLIALALIFLVWSLFWWAVIANGEVLYIRDLALFAAPSKQYLIERLAAGQLPFWTSHVSAGMPFLADPANQSLYPPNVLLVVLHNLNVTVERALSWFLISHHLGALWSAFYLGRKLSLPRVESTWLALSYGLCGYTLSITDNITYLPATVWVPLGIACYISSLRLNRALPGARGWLAQSLPGLLGATLSVAMLLLAGDAFNCAILVIVLAVISVVAARTGRVTSLNDGCAVSPRRLAIHWASVLFVGVLICAAQILPALELLQFSVRRNGVAYEELTQWSFHPVRLLEFVQPYFFGAYFPTYGFLRPDFYPQTGQPWAGSVYVGGLSVVAALGYICARWRQAWPWTLVIVVALFLSFGAHVEFHRTLVESIPFLSSQRYPEKFMFWVTFGVLVLAAIGVGSWRQHSVLGQTSERWRVRPLVKLFITTAIVGVALWLLVDVPTRALIWSAAHRPSIPWQMRLPDSLTHIQAVSMHLLLVLIAALSLLWVAARRRSRLLVLLMMLGVGDLLWMHTNSIPLAPGTLALTQRPPAVLKTFVNSQPDSSYRIYFDPIFPGRKISFQQGALADALQKNLAGSVNDSVVANAGIENQNAAVRKGYAPLYAYLFRGERLQNNAGILFGFEYLNGRASPLQPIEHRVFEQILLDKRPERFAAVSNAKYVITSLSPRNPQWEQQQLALRHVDPELNLRVLEVLEVLPRVLVVAQQRVEEGDAIDHANAVASLTDIRRVVITDRELIGDVSHVVSPIEITASKITAPQVRALEVSRPTPERLIVKVGAGRVDAGEIDPGKIDPGKNEPSKISPDEINPDEINPDEINPGKIHVSSGGFLLVNESYFQGWQASVNGKQVGIAKANGRYMAVSLPPGDANVLFEYRSTYWPIGAIFSLIGLSILLSLASVAIRLRRA